MGLVCGLFGFTDKYLFSRFCLISDNFAASLSTISKSFIFLPFLKYCWNVLFLDFMLHLVSSFIRGGSLSLIAMTFLLTKSEKKKLNCMSFSISTCFLHLHWKTIYFNQSCLRPFELSLLWRFCNPKQFFGKVGDMLFAGWTWHMWFDDDSSHEVMV